MKDIKKKNEILVPKNLWIVDTRVCTLYNKTDNCCAIHSETGRKDIAVVYTGDSFIELSTISDDLKLSKCSVFGIIPTGENEEYVDIQTVKPFSYESWFDFENVTVESLKEMDSVRKIKKYIHENS